MLVEKKKKWREVVIAVKTLKCTKYQHKKTFRYQLVDFRSPAKIAYYCNSLVVRSWVTDDEKVYVYTCMSIVAS